MRSYVVGDPIAHSLSPAVHNAAYRACGLPHEMEARELPAEQLGDFVSALAGDTLGCAVTMPHKQAIGRHLDSIEPLAMATGAINTVVVTGRIRTGFNTDVFGISQALRETGAAPGEVNRAVVIGAGATAASALAALGELAVRDITVVARRFSGPGSITMAEARLGVRTHHQPLRDREALRAAVRGADVVISTLPRGVGDQYAGELTFQSGAFVLDVAYNPWRTEMLSVAERSGARVVPGYLMLLHQARQQFQLMTGVEAPTEVMRRVLVDAESA